MSLVWLDPEKSCRKRDSNPGSSALGADALTTRPTRQSGKWRDCLRGSTEAAVGPHRLSPFACIIYSCVLLLVTWFQTWWFVFLISDDLESRRSVHGDLIISGYNAMVQSSRNPAGMSLLLCPCWHLESGLYICGNGKYHCMYHIVVNIRDADFPLFSVFSIIFGRSVLYFLLFHLSLSELSVSFCVHFLWDSTHT